LAAFVGLSIVAPGALGSDGAKEPEEGVHGVSLIQLIASPQEFHGKLVGVIGFVHLEFEGDALYVHEQDYARAISKNSIWVSLPTSAPKCWHDLTDQYVLVKGRFNEEKKGHRECCSGSLEEITRFVRWPSSEEFREGSPSLRDECKGDVS